MSELKASDLQQAAILAELRELRGVQAELCALVRDHLAGRLGGRDAALVHAIEQAFGGREFTSRELLARATWADGPGRLLAAVTEGMTVRQVGMRLAGLRDQPTGRGLLLRQVEQGREGASWQIRRVSAGEVSRELGYVPPARRP